MLIMTEGSGRRREKKIREITVMEKEEVCELEETKEREVEADEQCFHKHHQQLLFMSSSCF
jgi:hypothetical protein